MNYHKPRVLRILKITSAFPAVPVLSTGSFTDFLRPVVTACPTCPWTWCFASSLVGRGTRRQWLPRRSWLSLVSIDRMRFLDVGWCWVFVPEAHVLGWCCTRFSVQGAFLLLVLLGFLPDRFLSCRELVVPAVMSLYVSSRTWHFDGLLPHTICGRQLRSLCWDPPLPLGRHLSVVSQGDALECGSELDWWLRVAPDTSLHCWLWSYPHPGIFDAGWANSIGLPDFGNPENASNQQRTPGPRPNRAWRKLGSWKRTSEWRFITSTRRLSRWKSRLLTLRKETSSLAQRNFRF